MPRGSNVSDKFARLMIAEDDPDDQVLIRDALQDNGFPPSRLLFVNDGRELLDALGNAIVLPHLVLLDLNMPRMDGREALVEIKTDIRLRHVPVVIFSTSNSDDDVRAAYQNGSNTFFSKPARYSDMVSTMGIIKRYWFDTALTASC